MQEKQRLSGRGVLGCAVDLISFEQAAQPAIAYLLGRTVIVENMDAAIELGRRNPFSFRCVTLQGDMLQSGGAMTGGSVRERGLISRDRLIEQAKTKVNSEKEKAQTLQAEYRARQKCTKQSRPRRPSKSGYMRWKRAGGGRQKLDATQFVCRGPRSASKAQTEQKRAGRHRDGGKGDCGRAKRAAGV
ncbi:MAG: hypothetical protein ACLUO4_00795 [Christensenellales bacterium]